MSRSLGARLFAGALLFLGMALFMTWLALTQLFETYVNNSYQRELNAIADTLAAGIRVDETGLSIRREPADPRFKLPAGGRYWQVSGLKDGLQRSRSLWDLELKPGEPLADNANLRPAAGPDGGELLTFATEVKFENNGKQWPAVITVGADRTEYDSATADFRQQLFIMLGLTGLFLSIASALQIFVGLRPLVDLRRSVTAVRQGHSIHIDDQGPVEVRPLVQEINTLLDAERAAVERARARAADLAHGLKTPLTVLSQIGETLQRDGQADRAATIMEQVGVIRERTDRQLALARTGGRGSTVIDAGAMTERLIKVVGPIAASRNIRVSCEFAEPVSLLADATDYAEAVGNLIDNAMQHARSLVKITGGRQTDAVRITVSDDGSGIAENDRQTALARGHRLDESGTGTGLGLAITADILRAYGGSISLDTSAMGGLAVHLDWPTDKRKTHAGDGFDTKKKS